MNLPLSVCFRVYGEGKSWNPPKWAIKMLFWGWSSTEEYWLAGFIEQKTKPGFTAVLPRDYKTRLSSWKGRRASGIWLKVHENQSRTPVAGLLSEWQASLSFRQAKQCCCNIKGIFPWNRMKNESENHFQWVPFPVFPKKPCPLSKTLRYFWPFIDTRSLSDLAHIV